ncbi:MAG: energy-coupled thiamine transporter ThiT [Ruminococcaceae bacterium]|nr:energy-coupled thiamine transporter ThiT [Oscillospiraceae bacterium]
MKNKTALRLTEGAVMIALATVLSMIKLADFPYGGSITAASMFPIAVIAYRHGTVYGLFCGLIYGGIQQLLGLNTLSYFTSWQSILAIILLDYIVAFAVLGLAGAFRKLSVKPAVKMTLGVLLACTLRYLCHVISGCTVWAGLSIPDSAALLYSLAYNATYMIPETLIGCIATWYLFSMVDFASPRLKRLPSARSDALPAPARVCYRSSVLLAVLGVCYAIIRIFPLLQDEGGNFDFAGIKALDVNSFGIVLGICVLLILILLTLGTLLKNKKAEH